MGPALSLIHIYKDMQEDKEAVFDAVDTLHMCLTAFVPMVDTMKVLPENMRKAAAKGFINATDCADYLVGKGLPFRDAYKAVSYTHLGGRIMDTALAGGDFSLGANGLPRKISGEEELLQRAAFRLRVPLGRFAFQPTLGSRLYTPVSYTHLDVYKRQALWRRSGGMGPTGFCRRKTTYWTASGA